MPTADIVVTTIFEPAWIAGYLESIQTNGWIDDVTLRIICDQKTPASVLHAAEEARSAGFHVDCPTLDEQTSYLASLGLDDLIAWNSDHRRNVGFLRSWESGADVLISIDDDNYCRSDSDFVASHSVVGRRCADVPGDKMAADGAWFNVCSLLEGTWTDPVYPRGYPYEARGGEQHASVVDLSPEVAAMSIAVNAGLWLDEPDVDALTRLSMRPTAKTAKLPSVVLGPEVWSPINTQNTSLTREAIPAYYYLKMGFPLQGMRIDRFGDILSGYFLEACAKHLGQVIRFGAPVADHHRTPHNLFVDLYHELAGIVLVEELVPWLRELPLSGTSYAHAYEEVAEALAAEAHRFTGFVWDDGGRAFLTETARHMKRWLGALEVLDR